MGGHKNFLTELSFIYFKIIKKKKKNNYCCYAYTELFFKVLTDESYFTFQLPEFWDLLFECDFHHE